MTNGNGDSYSEKITVSFRPQQFNALRKSADHSQVSLGTRIRQLALERLQQLIAASEPVDDTISRFLNDVEE